MFKRILLAYDGSDGARKGLEAGIELAKLHQAELVALAVQEQPPGLAGITDKRSGRKRPLATSTVSNYWRRPKNERKRPGSN